MSRLPLHHIVRVRSADDLAYIRPGIMDEVLVNRYAEALGLRTPLAAVR